MGVSDTRTRFAVYMETKMPESDRCEVCKFYFVQKRRGQRDDEGECRRYPPRDTHGEYAEFPVVTPQTYCGEFVRKEAGP